NRSTTMQIPSKSPTSSEMMSPGDPRGALLASFLASCKPAVNPLPLIWSACASGCHQRDRCGKIRRVGRMLSDYHPLSTVGLITPHAGLLPLQQFGQHRAVCEIGGRRPHGVDQLGAAVDPEMRLHPKIPLDALLRVVHLG